LPVGSGSIATGIAGSKRRISWREAKHMAHVLARAHAIVANNVSCAALVSSEIMWLCLGNQMYQCVAFLAASVGHRGRKSQ